MSSDDAFCRTAIRLGFLTQAQVDEGLRTKGPETPAWESFLRQGILAQEQVTRVLQEVGPDLIIGRKLGGCLVLRKIGEGGMGAVFQARHLGLDRTVAIKIVSSAITSHPDSVERFMREARALAKVEHPNIVGVHDVAAENGIHYIVMQFVEGRSLGDRIREGPVEAREAARIARDVARGLEAAHGAGIVHRDLKPQNVILAKDGTPKIVDFGLAREMKAAREITEPGDIVGSPFYMAPEQCTGQPVDARTDLYALGATLYHMLTGQPPFAAETVFSLLQHHVASPPPDPRDRSAGIPEPLARITTKLLSKNPEDRYPSARETADEIDRFLGGREIRAPEKSRSLLPLALVPAVLVGLFLVYRATRPAAQAPPPPAPTARKETRLRILTDAAATVSVTKDERTVFEGTSGTVEPGAYRVVVRLDPFCRVETVTAVEGEETSISIDPREKIGRLHLVSEPKAQVELNGEPAGETPCTLENLELRRHTVRFSADGHVAEEIAVTPAGSAILRPPPVRLRRYGRLALRVRAYGRGVKPEGLSIVLVGAEFSEHLAPGRYKLRIEHPQITPWEEEIEIEPGKTLDKTADLEALPEWEGMVFVAPGSFLSGEKREPAMVGPYYIDRCEVTQRKYREYLNATGVPAPRLWTEDEPDLPVRSVTWKQAADYAAHVGRRLPTAREWEKAARGTKGFDFPWGNVWKDSAAWTEREGRLLPMRVTEIVDDRSPYGCLGMAGNVREWTSTPSASGRYFLCGSSFAETRHFAKTWYVRDEEAINTNGTNGFRCAADFLPGLWKEE